MQAVVAEKVIHLLPPAGKIVLQLCLEFSLAQGLFQSKAQNIRSGLPPVGEAV